MSDTIAAISTPAGTGGISVIRISGSNAIAIANKIFSKDISNAPTHTIHYGYIVENGNKIDEVLLSVMRAPKTFTREDVVEISTHGGIIVTNKVLECVINQGAGPALPGEFTKRAFLNGRIDLTQAEAVIDIINAGTELYEKNAFSQLRGVLSEKIGTLRQKLIDLSAHMQVSIDYPDEELEDITENDIKNILFQVKSDADKLLDNSKSGKMLQDGIRTAIVGRPNVGKSSLLNCILGTNRAIVTDIAGTTRDSIEELVNLRGIPIRLIDTAGIHKTEDKIEKIGVLKSIDSINSADLVIVVIDGTSPLTAEDKDILETTKNKKRIILINKSDLFDVPTINLENSIVVSAKKSDGMDILYNKIFGMFSMGDISASSGAIITNLRHVQALQNAVEALKRAITGIASGMPQDIFALDVYNAIDYLGEITGATISEDIVSAIFKDFCVGK